MSEKRVSIISEGDDTRPRATLRTRIRSAGALGWEVNIPPYTDAHFEGGRAHPDAPILGVYSDTYWPTWEEARAFAERVLSDYTDAPTGLRIYFEDEGDEWPWHLDGIDPLGRYTAEVWQYATREEAEAAIPAFVERVGGLRPVLTKGVW